MVHGEKPSSPLNDELLSLLLEKDLMSERFRGAKSLFLRIFAKTEILFMFILKRKSVN